MIPKILHYCWFGGNPLPDNIKNYISTWEKFFPEYKIIQWNESNFDLNSCTFVKEAYQKQKWAFVSDYVRINVMYHYGGIYFDTDIEVKKDISRYLNNCSLLLGFESKSSVMTAFFAAEPQNNFIKHLLEIYHNRKFVLPDGKCDVSPNPILFTKELQNVGMIPNGEQQKFGESYFIYPYDYFSAFNIYFQKYDISANTCLVHHCLGSWQSPKDIIKQKIKSILLKIIGAGNFERLKKIYKI